MECKKCGECCTGSGYILVKKKDIDRYEKFKDLVELTIPLFNICLVNIEGSCPYLTRSKLCEKQKDKPDFCKKRYCTPLEIRISNN
ncbi:MAG: YkgJ family cysteine cluster protein [Candidatus Woesearchaeota archaeon]|nr:MAG: YkgJ family cysteine cluster protein [Candidatus Woesearchaeota archaeon]